MDNLSWKSHKIDDLLKKELEHKKAFLCSTDTVLGLMAPATQNGKETLDAIKKRTNKPYLIILGSLSQIEYFIDKNVQTTMNPVFKKIWPGPITLILPAKKGLAEYYTSMEKTVALRLPKHKGLQKAALYYQGVFSTSANIHGMPIPESIDEVDQSILKHIAAIITDKEPKKATAASTIVDCTKKPYIIVREGAYQKEKLIALLDNAE